MLYNIHIYIYIFNDVYITVTHNNNTVKPEQPSEILHNPSTAVTALYLIRFAITAVLG